MYILPPRLFSQSRETSKLRDIPLACIHTGTGVEEKQELERLHLINILFANFLESKTTPEWYNESTQEINASIIKEKFNVSDEVIGSLFQKEGITLKKVHILQKRHFREAFHNDSLEPLPETSCSRRNPSPSEIQRSDSYTFIKEIVFNPAKRKLEVLNKEAEATNPPQRHYQKVKSCPSCSKPLVGFIPIIPLYVQNTWFKNKEYTFTDFKKLMSQQTEEVKKLKELFLLSAKQPITWIEDAKVDPETGLVLIQEESFRALLSGLCVDLVLYGYYSTLLAGLVIAENVMHAARAVFDVLTLYQFTD